MNTKDRIKQNRIAIKPIWNDLNQTKSDRDLGKPRPDNFKHQSVETMLIDLKKEFPNIKQKTLLECIENRRSLRQYSNQELSFEEMSYILYETASVKDFKPGIVFRTIPTGGATNAMETYVYIDKVKDIQAGLYHYYQDTHQLCLIDQESSLRQRVNVALYNQFRDAAIVLFLTTIPYRSEYKYQFAAHKMIAMEAGHAFQNTSLAAEVIDCGGVCIAAYDQDKMDELLQVDGENEFSTYAYTLGKK